MDKIISAERLTSLLEKHVPMEESHAQTINMQFPVFKVLFNEMEADEDWLKSVSMEQLEFAMDSLQYTATEEDEAEEVNIHDHRNPAFEYVYAREWQKDAYAITPARIKPKFF